MQYLYNEMKFPWSRSIFTGVEEIQSMLLITKKSYKKFLFTIILSYKYKMNGWMGGWMD